METPKSKRPSRAKPKVVTEAPEAPVAEVVAPAKKRSVKKKAVEEEVIADVSSNVVDEPQPQPAVPLASAKPKRIRPSRAKPKDTIGGGEPNVAKKQGASTTTNGGGGASGSKDDTKADTVILQLNIKKPVEGETANFEEAFFKYEPNVDVPDAYDQQECNDYVSQPFDVTKVEEETVVPNYAINPPVKTKKKPTKTPASKINLDKKSNRIFDHLSDFIARDEWPMSTNNVCFWCCHAFHNTPFGVPTKYIDSKFHVFGCLCSLECTSAYNFYSTEIKHDPWESYNLINLLARKIQYCDLVKMAPPRHALKMFGGYMEIDEFRSHCKSNKMINTHTFPMVAMIQQLEEVNEEDQYSNRKNMFIPVDKQKLFLLESKVKLERTKPLFMNKNTLDHTMNLRIAETHVSVDAN